MSENLRETAGHLVFQQVLWEMLYMHAILCVWQLYIFALTAGQRLGGESHGWKIASGGKKRNSLLEPRSRHNWHVLSTTLDQASLWKNCPTVWKRWNKVIPGKLAESFHRGIQKVLSWSDYPLNYYASANNCNTRHAISYYFTYQLSA